jgi:hypothetical protein
MNTDNFFAGFFKRAAEAKDEQAAPLLPRSMSALGPRLDAVTEESDRGKFDTFRG